MVTVSNDALSACNTRLFVCWKVTFHILKGCLLQTCRKQTETISKSRRNATNRKCLPRGGTNNSANGLLLRFVSSDGDARHAEALTQLKI